MNAKKLLPRFLIIGQGSMGKRRVRCLLAKGVAPEQIVVYDTRGDRAAESSGAYAVRSAGDLEAVLKDPVTEAVFVSVPGALHTRYCLEAARFGKHWFCEVPLAVAPDSLDELSALTNGDLVGAVGCQVLFHPLARSLRSWAQAPSTGRILAGSYSFGSYLPDWHPHEDYRNFYASDQSLGGGNLDVIAQELTWLLWVVGQRVRRVTCRMSKVGPLELAAGTPDHQELILEFESGLMLSMHFDLNDRSHERWLRLSAESSTAKWSTLEPVLRLYDGPSRAWSEERLPEGFDYETCYQEEIGQFLSCIRTREPWPVTFSSAREIVWLFEAMRVSSREGRTVELEEIGQ